MPLDAQKHVPRFRLVTPQSQPLSLAFDAFLIAQEAARHSPLTIKWYRQRLEFFVEFVIAQGVNAPEGITATLCRAFLVTLGRRGLKDTTIHGYAQVLKTFCRFLELEGFAPSSPMATVAMPKMDKRIMPAFAPDDVRALLRRLGKRAGGAHCTPHTFRRTCALWSLRAEMSIYHLQAIMGHASLRYCAATWPW